MSRHNALRVLLALIIAVSAAFSANAGVVLRQQIRTGAYAAIDSGRRPFLECQVPSGGSAQTFLSQFLHDPAQWERYQDRMRVAIPFEMLNSMARRSVLIAVFPEDRVDHRGWWHKVQTGEANGGESLQLVAEWFTGSAKHAQQLRTLPPNRAMGDQLEAGQRIFIPKEMLDSAFLSRIPAAPPIEAIDPEPEPEPEPEPMPEAAPVVEAPPDPEAPQLAQRVEERVEAKEPPRPELATEVFQGPPPGAEHLGYGRDSEGQYAEYHLQEGEALYTSVVVRYTDFRENADIHRALDTIIARSNIRDPRRMKVGQRVLIPMEMLSDQYHPRGTEARLAYESVQETARQLAGSRASTGRDLDGVVIILDPGHGGRDQGAAHAGDGLYEDELNYDIVCRIKALLEQQTRAKVYVTVIDPDQGYAPMNVRRFVHDTDEKLLTSPNYHNHDAKISANLRWYLANDIMRKEAAKGVKEDQVLFASVHCDALFNESLRGAMVYVPGAKYRRAREHPSGSAYNQYAEAREHRTVTTTPSLCQRDEAMSRNFARVFLDAMGEHAPPLKVHREGDPIRNVIRRSGGVAFVPAVLRNCLVPTKVLIETANLTNPTDRERLSDPEWRQWIAEVFIDSVRHYFSD